MDCYLAVLSRFELLRFNAFLLSLNFLRAVHLLELYHIHNEVRKSTRFKIFACIEVSDSPKDLD